MNLSIIIVNYNATELIAELLQTFRQNVTTITYEIIVVDNSNDSVGKEVILSNFPHVRWITMGYNAGFSRANNTGIRAGSGQVVLLLNPDTLVIDGSIQQCFQRLQQSAYVAAGVQLLNAKAQPQISGSHFVKWGLNHLLPIPYYGGLVRWAAYRLGKKAPGVETVSTRAEVDWISGAFLMVKREAVAKAGLLDEDFFLYAEEIEWCSRLGRVGKLCLYGDLKIIHLEGATINHFTQNKDAGYYNLYDRKGLQLMVSNHLRVRKQYGKGAFLFLLCNYTLGFGVYFFAASVRVFTNKRNFNWYKKRVIGFAKNMFRLWKLAPTIWRNKPYFYKVL